MSARPTRAGAGSGPAEPEPQAYAELRPLEEGDFHALSPGLARDPQYNDRRLVLRRKLASIAKAFVARAQQAGVALEARTSLHNPHAFNHMQVKRMWAYVCRDKAEKKRLARRIGAELARDLDAAYRNAYLCVALEADALEVSLRIHADAWYDGQNMVNRVRRDGVAAWKERLNALKGFRLKLADWKGEWPCGALERERLEEFLKYYKPGEHALAVERRWPAAPVDRPALFAPELPAQLVDELARLLPLYRWSAWSQESDHLFPG
jgi:hypothetical protein